jgi:hypothetical protein
MGKPELILRFPLLVFLLGHGEQRYTERTQESADTILNACVISAFSELLWLLNNKLAHVLHHTLVSIATVLIGHGIKEVPATAHVVTTGELRMCDNHKGRDIRAKQFGVRRQDATVNHAEQEAEGVLRRMFRGDVGVELVTGDTGFEVLNEVAIRKWTAWHIVVGAPCM